MGDLRAVDTANDGHTRSLSFGIISLAIEHFPAHMCSLWRPFPPFFQTSKPSYHTCEQQTSGFTARCRRPAPEERQKRRPSRRRSPRPSQNRHLLGGRGHASPGGAQTLMLIRTRARYILGVVVLYLGHEFEFKILSHIYLILKGFSNFLSAQKSKKVHFRVCLCIQEKCFQISYIQG